MDTKKKQEPVTINDAVSFYIVAQRKAEKYNIDLKDLLKVYELMVLDRGNNISIDNGEIQEENTEKLIELLEMLNMNIVNNADKLGLEMFVSRKEHKN